MGGESPNVLPPFQNMASMGSSLGSPVGEQLLVCPLCHGPFQQPSRLRCGHRFCHHCIQEVWSGSATGPYYCPECQEEGPCPRGADRRAESAGRNDTDGPSTSSASSPLGKRSPAPHSPPQTGKRGRLHPHSPSSTVSCHYCSSPGRPAAKSCLVCGASMCAEHLRAHLESPVFHSHPLVPPVADMSAWRCREHQEMNKIYCRQCGLCVCTVCTLIGGHKGHACCSIAEAERELRGNLKQKMHEQQQSEQAIQQRTTRLQENMQDVQAQLDRARSGVRRVYQAMREALEHEEAQALQCVSREERRVMVSMEALMEQQQEGLRSVQSALNACELLCDTQGETRLQDQAFITEYNKMSQGMSAASSPEEEPQAPQEVDRARLDQLQVWVEKRLETVRPVMMDREALRIFYGTVPTLNPDTAHPKLILSEENRAVSYSQDPQPYPDLPARFNVFPQVTGMEPREGGQSYWEVEVSGEGRWKVGVCDAGLGRKGPEDSSRLGFNKHSWCVFGERGRLEVIHDSISIPLDATCPWRVGILLDMEQDSLCFYSVAEEGALTPLHSFQQQFGQSMYAALAASKAKLTICQLFP